MPANRYADDDYGRGDPRSTRRPGDTRERDRDPRDTGRDRRTMEVERPTREVRMVDPMDRGIDMRDRIANTTATRVDPRGGRTVSSREDDMMYDTRTTNPYPREPRRTPYENEFEDLPPSTRPIIDPGQRRDDQGGRPRYNEYFLPGEGIDREVIQSEICRYLGQDATCKPGTHTDGRRGFIIRGYRALTTEMVRSLKEDSQKYIRERESAARRNQRAVPYAQLRDQTRYAGEDTMMIDDDDRREPRYSTGYSEMDPRMTGVRQPVTATYVEPGYAAYTQPGAQYDPRYVPPGVQQVMPGNTTPPMASNRTPTGYPQQAYAPVTTRAPGQPMVAPSGFGEYRSEAVRPSQYPPETGRRHR